jgi:hypothetical protein
MGTPGPVRQRKVRSFCGRFAESRFVFGFARTCRSIVSVRTRGLIPLICLLFSAARFGSGAFSKVWSRAAENKKADVVGVGVL